MQGHQRVIFPHIHGEAKFKSLFIRASNPNGVETTCVHQLMSKQNVVYSSNGISVSCEKGMKYDTRYNMNEPRKHYVT